MKESLTVFLDFEENPNFVVIQIKAVSSKQEDMVIKSPMHPKCHVIL